MSDVEPPLASPGVGMRRKGPKSLPRLHPSAFSPPNSGTSDRFPLPPSPSTVHPDTVVDAHVVLHEPDLATWNSQTGQAYGGRVGGVVVALQGADPEIAVKQLEALNAPILSIMVNVPLEAPPPEKLPASTKPISLSTVYTKPAPTAIEALRWALQNGRVVDLDVQCDITQEGAPWEEFEDLLTKATADLPKATPILLSNVLPPPDDLGLPIVKLMNHPTYRAYQAHVAALSLFPSLYIKLLPPRWSAATPATPSVERAQEAQPCEAKEWKRRIKMYVGPVMEAFGYERIVFGSSSAGTAPSATPAGDWYEIAREALAELGVEQIAIDGVFGANAKAVYGE